LKNLNNSKFNLVIFLLYNLDKSLLLGAQNHILDIYLRSSCLLFLHWFSCCLLSLSKVFSCWRSFCTFASHFLAASCSYSFSFLIYIFIQTHFVSPFCFSYVLSPPMPSMPPRTVKSVPISNSGSSGSSAPAKLAPNIIKSFTIK